MATSANAGRPPIEGGRCGTDRPGVKQLTILAIIFLALFAAACHAAASRLPEPTPPTLPAASVASATGLPTLAQPSATVVVPTPTPTVPPWLDLPLITQRLPVILTNTAPIHRGRDIYGSKIALNTNTRWNFDIQVDMLNLDVGDARTGIVLKGFGDNANAQSLLLAYHSGMWSMGYAPGNPGNEFTFWYDFIDLHSPQQHFELSISGDGRALSLKNDQGFKFEWTPPDKLFNLSQYVLAGAQIGPQTQITLSQFNIQQLGDNAAADTTSGKPSTYLPTPFARTLGAGQAEYVFHVAVNGSDSNPGTADKPFASLAHARDIVRAINSAMQGPIIVYLHGGVYSIRQTVKFAPEDSGQNGYDIIYRAAEAESPVLSGGISVGAWQEMPGSPIWKTQLPQVQAFRQLYVNGVRADRAAAKQVTAGLNWAKGQTSDRDGIVMSSGSVPAFARPQDLELHWIDDWRDMRLPVSNISKNPDGNETIWMRQPYFSYALSMADANDHGWFPRFDNPFYIENALELLVRPGQWYYNVDTRDLFYWPRTGEDLTTAQVVIPQTQQLVEIAGKQVGQEVHNLAFEGLTFAYAGWTRANTIGAFGWQDEQLITRPAWGQNGYDMTPAHVQVTFAQDITFQACRFEHLGAVALSLGRGAFNDSVRGNLFSDISDAALVVGQWDDAYITAPVIQAAPHDDLIANNLIESVGVEYWGAPAITAYYVANLQVVHNEIAFVPYTGISIGWGWSGTPDSTTSHGNYVANNLIRNLTLRARDGGGIYALGPQPGTIVQGNFIRNVTGDYACLYPDEGSAFMLFRNNVCDTAPLWLRIWTRNIHDVQVSNSYTNVPNLLNDGTNISIQNTVSVSGQAWPAEAQAIIDQAGLEPGYSYLRAWLSGN